MAENKESDSVPDAPVASPGQQPQSEEKMEKPDSSKEPAAASKESTPAVAETESEPMETETEVKEEAEEKPPEETPNKDEKEEQGAVPSDQPKELSEGEGSAVTAPPEAPPELQTPQVAEGDMKGAEADTPAEPMEVTESEAVEVQHIIAGENAENILQKVRQCAKGNK
nr:fibrous sheath CABYR-binding protein-like [Lytechinus pictus]